MMDTARWINLDKSRPQQTRESHAMKGENCSRNVYSIYIYIHPYIHTYTTYTVIYIFFLSMYTGHYRRHRNWTFSSPLSSMGPCPCRWLEGLRRVASSSNQEKVICCISDHPCSSSCIVFSWLHGCKCMMCMHGMRLRNTVDPKVRHRLSFGVFVLFRRWRGLPAAAADDEDHEIDHHSKEFVPWRGGDPTNPSRTDSCCRPFFLFFLFCF